MVPIEFDLSELFFSIQGESTFAGFPCVFIRLAGCNLRCHYCDARYTYEEKAKRTNLATLLTFAQQYPEAIVEVTGGEPLIQASTYALLAKLLELKRTVLLETNGSLDISAVPAKVIKIMDLKCPDSGMTRHMLLENVARLGPDDQLKFVISSYADYQWAKETIAQLELGTSSASPHLLFSAVIEQLPIADLAQWLLADQLHKVRLQPQLHKFIWPGCSRAV